MPYTNFKLPINVISTSIIFVVINNLLFISSFLIWRIELQIIRFPNSLLCGMNTRIDIKSMLKNRLVLLNLRILVFFSLKQDFICCKFFFKAMLNGPPWDLQTKVLRVLRTKTMTTDLLYFITSSSIILLIIICSKPPRTSFLPSACSVVILLISQWSCKNRSIQLVYSFNIVFLRSVGNFFGLSLSSFLGRRRVNALANHPGVSISPLKVLLNNC